MCVRENMLFPDNVSILGLDLTNVHGLTQNFNFNIFLHCCGSSHHKAPGKTFFPHMDFESEQILKLCKLLNGPNIFN